MMCSKCKKRPAVVFITSMNGNETKNEGLCLLCAKQMNIPQVDSYLKSMGISDDELESFADSMAGLMGGDADGDSFETGGFGTIPNMINQIFSKDSPLANGEGMDLSSIFGSGAKEESHSEEKPSKDKKQKKLKFLTTYCTNLTQKAKDGKLDNIIGRDREIERVIQILSRRTKNNPCLIGEPGVGKTAIAEGIAQRIAAGNVPFQVADKELYLLDLTALVAGTQFRGQFESRVKGLVDEVKALGNVILFIDEVHNLVGTGDSEGSMNAANILKPSLSRGEIQVIGATTFKEYRKYIEKDSALERRFQPVTVTEPNIEETIEVLRGIKSYYENHHRVHIDDDTLRMCAVLSERYINDRFLPDKAIDLLDEACAATGIASEELIEIDKLNKKLKTLMDEKAAAEADAEKPDYEKLATVNFEISQTKEKLIELEEKAKNVKVEMSSLAKVIELWTGIPANKIIETEYGKIKTLKDALLKKIIGQDEAVEQVYNAVKRSRVSLTRRKRPASFIFVGPTGVGKTELVKVLADELFSTPEPLIRLDMSEYMEKHSISRMIGSPPGYVGYDEAGQLTEKVRRRPYSVILFDEIEKAHPDVMNLLLQILDEGKVNDAQGRSVNFENTIIVMTSNAGSTSKDTGVGFNKTDSQIAKDKAIKGLREFLRPEFISRIDEVVVFNTLTEENYADIAALMLDEMKEPLAEKGIKFGYDKKACAYIAKKAFDKKYGARDIRKIIREEIEDEIATTIIDEGAINFALLSVSVKNNKLSLTKK